MSEEEIQMLRQVQEMTGIDDVKIAANAMAVFNTMDPILVQMIGQLDPGTIQELLSGNPVRPEILESLPNLEHIRLEVTKGRISPEKMQHTPERRGFHNRGQKRSSFRGRGNYKRNYSRGSLTGPSNKRGR